MLRKAPNARDNFDDPSPASATSTASTSSNTSTETGGVTLAAAKKKDGELCDTKAECKSNRCIVDDAGEFGHWLRQCA